MIIITKINWSLFNDDKIIIANENVECEFVVNKFIKYLENDTSNYIDLENKIYIRENNEFMFKIDYKNNLFNYILKENNIKLENEIDCEFIINDNEIILKYKIDEEEKKIIIQIL